MRSASISGRSAHFPRQLASALVVFSLIACCPACSSGRKPVYPVKGQLLVNGEPAANAQILFHPAEGGKDEVLPTGHTDDEGYFTLTSYAKGDGAAVGDYSVTVTWFRVYRVENRGDAEFKRFNALPQQYAKPTTSSLRATVNKGKNELPAFEISVR